MLKVVDFVLKSCGFRVESNNFVLKAVDLELKVVYFLLKVFGSRVESSKFSC